MISQERIQTDYNFILKTFVRIVHIADFIPSREVLIDIQLPDGQIMPAGTTYCIDLAALQLNKRVWGDDVLEFNPNRFETTKTHTYQETVWSVDSILTVIDITS